MNPAWGQNIILKLNNKLKRSLDAFIIKKYDSILDAIGIPNLLLNGIGKPDKNGIQSVQIRAVKYSGHHLDSYDILFVNTFREEQCIVVCLA